MKLAVMTVKYDEEKLGAIRQYGSTLTAGEKCRLPSKRMEKAGQRMGAILRLPRQCNRSLEEDKRWKKRSGY